MYIDERYVDGSYLAANPDWDDGDTSFKATYVARMLADHGIEPTSIADVGCGAGGVLRWFRDHHPPAELVGFDVSPQAIDLAHQSGAQGIEYVVGLPFEQDRRFDVALALDVFEHVEDSFAFLRSLREVSDFQIFHIPLALSVSSILRPHVLISSWHQVGHIHQYNRELALELLDHCGYQVLDDRLLPAALEAGHQRALTPLANLARRCVRLVSERWASRLLGGFSLLVLTRAR